MSPATAIRSVLKLFSLFYSRLASFKAGRLVSKPSDGFETVQVYNESPTYMLVYHTRSLVTDYEEPEADEDYAEDGDALESSDIDADYDDVNTCMFTHSVLC